MLSPPDRKGRSETGANGNCTDRHLETVRQQQVIKVREKSIVHGRHWIGGCKPRDHAAPRQPTATARGSFRQLVDGGGVLRQGNLLQALNALILVLGI